MACVTKGCIFCGMSKNPREVPFRIAESEHALAFLTTRPVQRGHSLVIPKRHATDLSDVAPPELNDVMALVLEVATLLRRRLNTTGENLLVASGPGSGQSVFHLHVHIIPRILDDGLQWNDWWHAKVHLPPEGDLDSLAGFIRGQSS